ncbi:hypothetical protein [Breoghania sp. L-A4]|uniref:hypothetical protein n=1 Tax=Breoghania sp. L-A4 TaxID=2304600 RepID=UPI000E35CCC2|nr:hypothetical protein [Breoghania sp. L-A4]AXS42295.1 hypothetical protein D1F64_22775 [Breoghania sp. L-A4]
MAVRPGDDGALLISGGARDPNLHALAAAARTAGVMVHAVLHDAESEPALSWDLETGEMTVAGRPLVCAAAFQRYDVFSVPQAAGAIDRAQAWFSALGAGASHTTQSVSSTGP